MTNMRDVLLGKDGTLYTAPPDLPVKEALALMNRHRVGCLVVICPDGVPRGILSERDILRHLDREGCFQATETIRPLMTPREKMIIATPADGIDYAMRVMTENRIRHLPVVEKGKVIGVVSIGDMIKSQLSDTMHENKMLQDYITGRYPV